jgi:hypothetical protein
MSRTPNNMAMINTRLNTTVAPLVAQEFLTTRPYFFMANAEGTETRNSVSSLLKNKGASEKLIGY